MLGYINKASDNTRNDAVVQAIIDEIIEETEAENERLRDIAESVSEASYEAIPIEIRTPYNHRAATAYKKSCFESCMAMLNKGRLIIDLASIVIRKLRRNNRPIAVIYENSPQDGLFEKALADIFSRKIKSGSIEL